MCVYIVHVYTLITFSLYQPHPPSTHLLRGPTDVVMNGRNTSMLMLDNLHVQGSSPTVYQFTLTVFDYANLNSSESVFLYYYKGKKKMYLSHPNTCIYTDIVFIDVHVHMYIICLLYSVCMYVCMYVYVL